jgi:hypothetical protein
MQYCELGLGFSLENEIIHNPKVFDLLISVFVTYVTHSIDERFDMTFFNSYNIGVDAIKKCVSLIPTISDMEKLIAKNIFKDTLNKIDGFMIPLLKWIVTSNRSYLKVIDKSDVSQLTTYQTKEVFMMKTATIKREKAFDTLKSSKGVTYLYHGSSFQNWHLILKMGIVLHNEKWIN